MSHSRNLPRKPLTGRLGRVSLSALIYVVFSSFHQPIVIEGGGAEYHTEIGRQQALRLADHSEIHMGGNTDIVVNDAAHFRSVLLQNGEIYTTVHHDDRRPFRVIVGHLVVDDIGTAYNVSKHGSTINIAVLEGQLRLYQGDDGIGWGDPILDQPGIHLRAPITMGPGDLARVEQLDDGTVVVNKTHAGQDVANQRAEWREGHMIASQQRLDEVVWEFDRYNRVQIVIDDPEVGKVPYGGALSLANVEGLIRACRDQYGIRVEVEKDSSGQVVSYHLVGLVPPGGGRQLRSR